MAVRQHPVLSMNENEAQIIAQTIGVVAGISAQVVLAKQLRNLETDPVKRDEWDKTIGDATDVRTQAIEQLGTLIAESCYSMQQAIEVNDRIIKILERIANDQKTVQ